VEIKRVNGSIAAARSQLNKAEEHLAACHRFKEFLDGITPPEHFAQERAEQERKRAAAEAAWLEECEAVRQAKLAAVRAKEQAELAYDNARTQQVCGPNIEQNHSFPKSPHHFRAASDFLAPQMNVESASFASARASMCLNGTVRSRLQVGCI
jgi:hypothetical protein